MWWHGTLFYVPGLTDVIVLCLWCSNTPSPHFCSLWHRTSMQQRLSKLTLCNLLHLWFSCFNKTWTKKYGEIAHFYLTKSLRCSFSTHQIFEFFMARRSTFFFPVFFGCYMQNTSFNKKYAKESQWNRFIF